MLEIFLVDTGLSMSSSSPTTTPSSSQTPQTSPSSSPLGLTLLDLSKMFVVQYMKSSSSIRAARARLSSSSPSPPHQPSSSSMPHLPIAPDDPRNPNHDTYMLLSSTPQPHLTPSDSSSSFGSGRLLVPFNPPIPLTLEITNNYIKQNHINFLSKLKQLKLVTNGTVKDNLNGFNVSVSAGIKLMDRGRTFDKYPLIPAVYLPLLYNSDQVDHDENDGGSSSTPSQSNNNNNNNNNTNLTPGADSNPTDLEYYSTGSDIHLPNTSDSPCLGRHPSHSSPSNLIIFTDGKSFLSKDEVTGKMKWEELKLNFVNDDLSRLYKEPFKWDQRVFVVLVQDDSDKSMNSLKCPPSLNAICEVTGGGVMTIPLSCIKFSSPSDNSSSSSSSSSSSDMNTKPLQFYVSKLLSLTHTLLITPYYIDPLLESPFPSSTFPQSQPSELQQARANILSLNSSRDREHSSSSSSVKQALLSVDSGIIIDLLHVNPKMNTKKNECKAMLIKPSIKGIGGTGSVRFKADDSIMQAQASAKIWPLPESFFPNKNVNYPLPQRCAHAKLYYSSDNDSGGGKNSGVWFDCQKVRDLVLVVEGLLVERKARMKEVEKEREKEKGGDDNEANAATSASKSDYDTKNGTSSLPSNPNPNNTLPLFPRDTYILHPTPLSAPLPPSPPSGPSFFPLVSYNSSKPDTPSSEANPLNVGMVYIPAASENNGSSGSSSGGAPCVILLPPNAHVLLPLIVRSLEAEKVALSKHLEKLASNPASTSTSSASNKHPAFNYQLDDALRSDLRSYLSILPPYYLPLLRKFLSHMLPSSAAPIFTTQYATGDKSFSSDDSGSSSGGGGGYSGVDKVWMKMCMSFECRRRIERGMGGERRGFYLAGMSGGVGTVVSNGRLNTSSTPNSDGEMMMMTSPQLTGQAQTLLNHFPFGKPYGAYDGKTDASMYISMLRNLPAPPHLKLQPPLITAAATTTASVSASTSTSTASKEPPLQPQPTLTLAEMKSTFTAYDLLLDLPSRALLHYYESHRSWLAPGFGTGLGLTVQNLPLESTPFQGLNRRTSSTFACASSVLVASAGVGLKTSVCSKSVGKMGDLNTRLTLHRDCIADGYSTVLKSGISVNSVDDDALPAVFFDRETGEFNDSKDARISAKSGGFDLNSNPFRLQGSGLKGGRGRVGDVWKGQVPGRGEGMRKEEEREEEEAEALRRIDKGGASVGNNGDFVIPKMLPRKRGEKRKHSARQQEEGVDLSMFDVERMPVSPIAPPPPSTRAATPSPAPNHAAVPPPPAHAHAQRDMLPAFQSAGLNANVNTSSLPPQNNNNNNSGGVSVVSTEVTEAQLTDEKRKPILSLPSGWVVVWSRSNKRWYFFNTVKNKSVWETKYVTNN